MVILSASRARSVGDARELPLATTETGPIQITAGSRSPLGRCPQPSWAGGTEQETGQNGGWSLKSPPRSACRSRPSVRSLWPRSLARSTLAVANFRLAPTSSASISATDRFSPSGVSQLRWRSRPVTITRSPFESESARCSAWPRHTFTLKKEVSPSRHSPSCWMRWVTATRRLVTGVPVLVKRCSGSSTRLPTMVVWLSAAMADTPSCWLAFGADPLRPPAGPGGLGAGGLDGVGHAVVLAGMPDVWVGVVLAAVVDGHLRLNDPTG